ncbi:MAG: formate dehydrogenase subunit delta [Alphaproteobacteria bacterium]|nr:formate dehydrogenase subunit delta [Alphaproteobacteria bacterium]
MDIARLIYMANQIASNFAAQGEDEAVAATADHIVKSWDPRMKRQLLDHGEAGLGPIAVRAMAMLREAEAS